MNTTIAVREITNDDITPICKYWQDASPEFLLGMGVNLTLQPDPNEFENFLEEQLQLPNPEKKSYCIIWLINEEAVGHCNVNKIIFGQEAYMHLHLWKSDKRQKGIGTEFVKRSLPYFFENLKLKTLFCEPYALNPAPNKTLRRIGFSFIKEYITIPGSFSFEQPVMRWGMTLEQYNELV